MIIGMLALLALWRPPVALAAALCVYGLEQWAQSQSTFFVSNPALTNYLAAAVVLMGVISRFARGRVGAGYPRLGYMILGLFLLAALSLIWTVAPEESISTWRRSWPYVLVFVVLAPLLVSDLHDLRTGMLATLFLATFLLVLVTLTGEWQGRSLQLQRTLFWAPTEDGGSPLSLASMAGYAAIISLLMNFRGLTRPLQLLRWLIVAAGIFVCFQSGSRGQVLALVAVGAALLPVSRQIRNIKGFAAAVIGIALFAALISWGFDQITEQQQQRWQFESLTRSYSARTEMAFTLLSHWAEAGPVRWVIGLGSAASYSPAIVGFYPHLVALEVLGELGLIGFALFCVIIFTVARNVWQAHRMVKFDPDLRGRVAALSGLFLYEFLLSFKQGSMLGNTNLFAFAILIGVVHRSLTRPMATPSSLPELEPQYAMEYSLQN